jgi:hypothetical protein
MTAKSRFHDQGLIDQDIDATQEEARHRSHMVHRLALGHPPLHGPDVCVRHYLVGPHGKEQGDVDALVQHFLDTFDIPSPRLPTR